MYKGLSVFEKGKGKICVSLMGKNIEEINENLEYILNHPVDVVEWRADFFNDLLDLYAVSRSIRTIKNKLMEQEGYIPLLFTIRTDNEGGNVHISQENYKKILLCICKESIVDMVDVEYLMGKAITEDIVLTAHEYNVAVVGSNHDFDETPENKVIYDRLLGMMQEGMDISKIAVMPNKKSDVSRVFNITQTINEDYPNILTITMAMGDMGTVSRVIGYMFGSVMTFGAGMDASAPGQINADKLSNILHELEQI